MGIGPVPSTEKALRKAGLRRAQASDELYGHVYVQAQVVSDPDFAHPACAQGPHELILVGYD